MNYSPPMVDPRVWDVITGSFPEHLYKQTDSAKAVALAAAYCPSRMGRIRSWPKRAPVSLEMAEKESVECWGADSSRVRAVLHDYYSHQDPDDGPRCISVWDRRLASWCFSLSLDVIRQKTDLFDRSKYSRVFVSALEEIFSKAQQSMRDFARSGFPSAYLFNQARSIFGSEFRRNGMMEARYLRSAEGRITMAARDCLGLWSPFALNTYPADSFGDLCRIAGISPFGTTVVVMSFDTDDWPVNDVFEVEYQPNIELLNELSRSFLNGILSYPYGYQGSSGGVLSKPSSLSVGAIGAAVGAAAMFLAKK